MLTLHKISAGAAGGYAAYLTDLEATGDYYVGPDGDPWAAPGEWLGGLADLLHLRGSDVDRKELLAVLDGCEPGTGRRIVARWRPDRVAAHDLVFSAPSSVTAAWALAGDDLRAAIQAAQDGAVAEVFQYIEERFDLIRRRDFGRAMEALRQRLGRDPLPSELRSVQVPIIRERAAALLGAAFSHHTSRQTAEQASAGIPPDPQLHTHVLLLSIAQRRDGQFVAINSLELHQRRAEMGAVYRAALASRLGAIGFTVERRTGKGARYFEIAGIPLALRDQWSSRHREIHQDQEKRRTELRALLGREPTKVELHKAGVVSRIKKGRFWRGDLFRWWRDIAAHHGVSPGTVEELRWSDGGLPTVGGRAALIAELLSAEGLTREHATFDLARLRVEAYERAPGLVGAGDVDQVLSDLVRHEQVVEVAPGVWTTRDILELEREVLQWRAARVPSRVDEAVTPLWGDTRRQEAEKGGSATAASERLPAPSPRTIEEAFLRCPVRLSDEQHRAVKTLVAGPYTALTGEAGTGKGVVVRVAADVWRRQHRRIFAIAVGGAQAQRLAADLGPGTQALTLDALCWRAERGYLELTSRDVVVLDEAGQVDTRRWASFARAVGHTPTVVALGDAAQLSSIAAGGLWPLLAKGGPRLTEVRRTKLEWEREAWAHLRRGESEEALCLYARHRRLEIHATRADALTAAVSAWDRDGRDGLIVTDASNAERHQANTAAQEKRLAARELGDQAVTARAGEGEVNFHAGDAVLFVSQYRRPDLDRRVENGTTADVIAVDPSAGTVRIRTHEASPREIEISVAVGEQPCPLDLYYAAHVVKAQGTTVRKAYVVAGGWQTHRESLYVACSRAREGTHLFVDRESLGHDADVEALEELVSRAQESRAKVAASDGEGLSARDKCQRQHRGPAGWRTPAPLSRHVQSQLAAVTQALQSETLTAASATGVCGGETPAGAYASP